MIIKITVFCDVTPSSLVCVYLRFGKTCCLNIQAWKIFTIRHIREDRNEMSALLYYSGCVVVKAICYKPESREFETR
jgi:hypothetical protein